MANDHTHSIGLVSMPWMAVGMPSIQLATLAALLKDEDVLCEVHEFVLDYAAHIGVHLYNLLSNGGGFTEEWIFARDYFEAENGNDLAEYRRHRPRMGLQSVELEETVLDALRPVTTEFLDALVQRNDWSRYDIVGFSLTISQTAASMALARRLKKAYPHLTIICGGASCAGPMGAALLRVCPYFDVIVSSEAELVLPALVQRIRRNETLTGLPGVSWRGDYGAVATETGMPIHRPKGSRRPLDYDGYFERLQALKLADRVDVWLPFESTRGCWYGEKVQCTFCGLHEIMAYRSWPWEGVLAELEGWATRYRTGKFFAVDLIMPRDYFETFLPEVERRGHQWSVFYEVKANMKRAELELLARAGVRWIQPGIESLDTTSLKLMRKGVSALQNIQLLKWCRELGIRVTWNMITGIPGEAASSCSGMSTLVPRLFHLTPPSGASDFELHRFSPMFEQPALFGIESLGAHPLYQYIFPIPSDVLDRLVYRHAYRPRASDDPKRGQQTLREAITGWQAAQAGGAELRMSPQPDGSLEIHDSRSAPRQTHVLDRSETALYLLLDAAVSEQTLPDVLQASHPDAARELAARGGVPGALERWDRLGLVVRSEGRVLALATRAPQAASLAGPDAAQLVPPVPYLSGAAMRA